jgi:hypothetical protein
VADERQLFVFGYSGRRLEGGQVEHLQYRGSAETVGGLGPGENRGSQRGSRDEY